MTSTIAVLGGDEREHHIAHMLTQWGATVRTFAGTQLDPFAGYQRARTAGAAVDGAQWLICPYPGMAGEDEVYAPAAGAPVRLTRDLLARIDAAGGGGLVLGRATPTVRARCEDLGIAIHETKADSGLAVQTASAVSEALLALLIENTDRLLRDHLFLVMGLGSTGFAITQLLLALRCDVIVAARSKRDRERARQLGAQPVEYADRVTHMETCDIVINTVPDPDAVPHEAGGSRTTARIFDIASPPGGMDHQALVGLGLDVSWLRGLGGLRAPVSMAEAQLAFIEKLITQSDPDVGPRHAVTDDGSHEVRAASQERSTT